MKIYIIAGEPSGDTLGSKLMAALKQLAPSTEFHGVGGELMQAQGIKSLFPMHEISLMGFAEVLPHIPQIMKRISQTVEDILSQKPDVVVTIDSPGFNFRVAKKLKGRGIKLMHYVAPTVWAYKPERAKRTAELYDAIMVLLPFEAEYFEREGLKTYFTGHPIVEDFKNLPARNIFRDKHSISGSQKLICLSPGSRSGELDRLLPIFSQVISQIRTRHPEARFVVPTLKEHENNVWNKFNSISTDAIIVTDRKSKLEAFTACDAGLSKSGTITLELSLSGMPIISTYKVHPITAWLLRRMVKVSTYNLVNLIAGENVIPEFIQENCTAEKLTPAIMELINNNEKREQQFEKSRAALNQLGLNWPETPSIKAAQAVLKS